MSRKVWIISLVSAFIVGYAISLAQNRIFFDGERVSVKMPGFSGEGVIRRSQLKMIEDAPGVVLCYEICFTSARQSNNMTEAVDIAWISGKFVHSKLGHFEKWRYLK